MANVYQRYRAWADEVEHEPEKHTVLEGSWALLCFVGGISWTLVYVQEGGWVNLVA